MPDEVKDTAEVAFELSVKARHVGESKNCWKYELAEPMKGVIYVPKNEMTTPIPEVNVACFA